MAESVRVVGRCDQFACAMRRANCASERWSALLFAMTVVYGAHIARCYVRQKIERSALDQNVQHKGRNVSAPMNNRLA